jgi:hypothetical protein
MAEEDEAVREMQDNLLASDQDVAQDGTSSTRPSNAEDLDETRRLLYMTLFASRTKRYNLVGTIVNAMRHHQGCKDEDLEERILAQVENQADDTWVRAQIARLTIELGEA